MSELVDVSEVISDPSFNQEFKVKRRLGQWDGPRWTSDNIQEIDTNGVIIPDKTRTMEVTKDGNLISGTISIWTFTELLTTTKVGNASSDIVIYKEQEYIVDDGRDMDDYGYYKYQAILRKAC